MPVKKESLFERLSQINVSEYTEKKGKFTYLSWAWAVNELKKIAPGAYWIIHEWGTGGNEKPYQQTESGCFVKVTVIAEGVEMTQIHPVLDNRNEPIKTPNAFEINTSIMRCLTKAISLHGLGLYIYAGEDLPFGESEKPKPLIEVENAIHKQKFNPMTREQAKIVIDLSEHEAIEGDAAKGFDVWLKSKELHSFEEGEKAIKRLQTIIDEYDGLEK
jgi:hypothetical protein